MEKIFFQTHGCSANFGETECMMGLLKKVDFELTNEKENADVIILNVCTVKGEDSMLAEFKKLKKSYPNKKFIVAGCVTKKLKKEIRDYDKECSITNTDNVNHIIEVVEETINDNPIIMLERKSEDKVGVPRVRLNPNVGLIPILNSCTGMCAFCSTKLVKGNLKSYPQDKIVNECRTAIRKGCKELFITSQDNACYMVEHGQSQLAELLKEIVEIPGDFKVRLGMANPEHILPIIDKLIKVMKNEKVYKFLHIPVQSGNNDVLKRMRRAYTIEEFKKIVNRFRYEIPNITIATDIICGFPGETNEQFDDTLTLIRNLTPEVLNISKFKKRQGTLAARMKQVDPEEINNRSRKLTSSYENISSMNNEKWHDWEGDVLITEHGKHENQLLGRNSWYKQVVLNGNQKIGDTIRVKINKTGLHDIHGTVMDNKIKITTY